MGQIFNRIKNIAKSQLNETSSDLNTNIFDSRSASDEDLAQEIENLSTKAETPKTPKTNKKIDDDDDFSVIDIETN
jgi:hypothetical protein